MTEVTTEDKPFLARPTATPYVGRQRIEDMERPVERPPETDPATVAATQETQPLTPEQETYKKRYDSLKAYHDQIITQLRRENAAKDEQLAKASQRQLRLPKSPEDIKEWANEFPDVAKIVETIAIMKAQEMKVEVDKQLEIVNKERLESRREKAEALLTRLHPDWEELKHDPVFHEWAQAQPEAIQAWLYTNQDDPRLAARAIDMYKHDKGLTRKEVTKSSSRDAVTAVETKGGGTTPTIANQKKIWTESEIAKLKPQEFEKYEKEILQAQFEGRIQRG